MFARMSVYFLTFGHLGFMQEKKEEKKRKKTCTDGNNVFIST